MDRIREEENLNLPCFSGEDPLGFIAEVEWQFVSNGVSEEEELPIVLECFEGRALDWLYSGEFLTPFYCLRDLWEAVLIRFGDKKITKEEVGKTVEGCEVHTKKFEEEGVVRVTVAEELTFLEGERIRAQEEKEAVGVVAMLSRFENKNTGKSEEEDAVRVTVPEEIMLNVEDEVQMSLLGSKNSGQEEKLAQKSSQDSWAMERETKPTFNCHTSEERVPNPKFCFNWRSLGFLTTTVGDERKEAYGARRVELGVPIEVDDGGSSKRRQSEKGFEARIAVIAQIRNLGFQMGAISDLGCAKPELWLGFRREIGRGAVRDLGLGFFRVGLPTFSGEESLIRVAKVERNKFRVSNLDLGIWVFDPGRENSVLSLGAGQGLLFLKEGTLKDFNTGGLADDVQGLAGGGLLGVVGVWIDDKSGEHFGAEMKAKSGCLMSAGTPVLGNLQSAQNRMKQLADKKRREVQFSEGQWVYLKIQPYRLRSLARKPNGKLGPKFHGPYQVLEEVGEVAYRLQLPDVAKIHHVFRASLLRQRVGSDVQPQALPDCLTEGLELQHSPTDVLSYRYSARGHLEVLIRWAKLPSSEANWEDYVSMAVAFPNYDLEDKVKTMGGSIDRTLIKRVYTRKAKMASIAN